MNIYEYKMYKKMCLAVAELALLESLDMFRYGYISYMGQRLLRWRGTAVDKVHWGKGGVYKPHARGHSPIHIGAHNTLHKHTRI